MPKATSALGCDEARRTARRLLDIETAKRFFGFRARVRFDDGLRQTIDWYKAKTAHRGLRLISMKILLVIPHLSGGGGERVLADLARGLAADEVVVIVFERKTTGYPVNRRIVSLDMPIYRGSLIRPRGRFSPSLLSLSPDRSRGKAGYCCQLHG